MAETSRIIFSGMQILVEDGWLKEHALIIEDGLIKVIIPEKMISHHLPANHYQFPLDHYLVPGLIDLHVHGVAGHDVMDGTEKALESISRSLAAEGITGFLATTMTAEKERIEKVLSVVPSAASQLSGAAILGIHLEGPFISSAKMGAQKHGEESLPDVALIKRWQHLAKNMIKLVTLAPELKGTLGFIDTLNEMDIVTSIGHTDATYEQTSAAIAAGCKRATHLFNAMRGLHQREPGAVGAILLDTKVNAELIVDGLHLHPAIVELVWKLKGKDHLYLVTDAIRAKCLGDGRYELGGQWVTVENGKAVLNDDTLAGSTLSMPQAIKNMMNFSHCSLEEALWLATKNPARDLGLLAKKGTIAIDKDADLVVLNASLEVELTVRGGKEIFKKSE